ncbi:hypothetical protein JDV02_002843 [Purpureocillium takamizusanense]|nr:uncharacterized protein JDV02_002843 [Purpureocillium takamizusanense]UNI16409.1 hypothetical protein JDV02_002843 [Purpureocillium takamizusanense]
MSEHGTPEASGERDARILGSKLYLASWVTYSLVTWTLKAAVCTLFLRLANNHHRGYRTPVFIGLGVLGSTFLAATLSLLLSCRPLPRMWQADEPSAPEPACRPASSPVVVGTYASFGIAAYVYLAALPVPMLAKSVLPAWQRALTTTLVVCGLVAAAAAALRAEAVSSQHDARLSRQWALREEFIALLTVNLACIVPTVIQHVVVPLNHHQQRQNTHRQWALQSHLAGKVASREACTDDESQTTCIGTVYVIDVSEKVETEVEEVAALEESEPQIQRRVEVCVVAEQDGPEATSGNYTGVWTGSKGRVLQTRSKFFGDHIHQRAYVRM